MTYRIRLARKDYPSLRNTLRTRFSLFREFDSALTDKDRALFVMQELKNYLDERRIEYDELHLEEVGSGRLRLLWLDGLEIDAHKLFSQLDVEKGVQLINYLREK